MSFLRYNVLTQNFEYNKHKQNKIYKLYTYVHDIILSFCLCTCLNYNWLSDRPTDNPIVRQQRSGQPQPTVAVWNHSGVTRPTAVRLTATHYENFQNKNEWRWGPEHDRSWIILRNIFGYYRTSLTVFRSRQWHPGVIRCEQGWSWSGSPSA